MKDYATTTTCGQCPYERGVVITVHFQGSRKGYEYFWFNSPNAAPIEPGDKFIVVALEEKKEVTVHCVRPAAKLDRLKCAYKRLGYRSKPTTEFVRYNAPTTTETTTMIKITNQTFINGREFKDYNDQELIRLMRETQKEIDTLSELQPIPKRFQKKIEELEAGRQQLVELLDKVDEE